MKPEDKHADAILRVCSYHRLDFDLAMIRSRPYATEPVQDSLQTAFDISPTSGLGDLDYLPEELIIMVIKNLDILTHFRFRRVNRYARILSTVPREYQLVVKYGVEGLRALLRSGCARSFTIVDLCRILITDRCELCGQFGDFLFLLTATRCCYNCLRSSPKLDVISTTDFARIAKISTCQLSKSYGSTLRTVSGSYSIYKTRDRRPKKLILKAAAIAALAPQTVFKEYSIDNLLIRAEPTDRRFMASMAFPCYDTSTGKIEHGVNCKGCQVRVELYYRGFRDRDTVFSKTGFLTHFASCDEAQDLWAESQEGTVPVKQSEFLRRGCLFGDWY